ncbi:MAG: histidine phosphatase family protein [Planctomycetaceae bacterium]|nr:histidine phosphatase family protein [Planctomycetaceae bacterium]
MATIVLIRAGCTDYDDQHRLLGTLDLPLNQRGVDQIREAVQVLNERGIRLEAIYTSPEDPACGTAHVVAESQASAKVRELDELRNVNQGLWQGLPEADIRKRFPKLFKNCKDSPVAICPPEGETLSDACQRLTRVLTKAIRKYDVFAIVAPEPLATVIRCTLERRHPRVSACLCGEEQKELLQIIEAESFDAERFLAGEFVAPAENSVTVASSNQENAR